MTVVIVRYGEIGIKSNPVRKRFEERLVSNIKSGFEADGMRNFSVSRGFGRIYAQVGDFKAARNVLSRVFGIVSFSPCTTCKADMGQMCSRAVEAVKWGKGETFAVRARRIGSHGFSSRDVNVAAGDALRKATGAKVDLENPDNLIEIEVRDETAYIYTETFKGQGGLPLGTQGKAACIIYAKRDLLAAWLMCKRGSTILPVYLSLPEKKAAGFQKIIEKWHCGSPLQHAALSGKGKSLPDIIKSVSGLTGIEAVVIGMELGPMEMQEAKSASKLPVFYPLFGFAGGEKRKLEKAVGLNYSGLKP